MSSSEDEIDNFYDQKSTNEIAAPAHPGGGEAMVMDVNGAQMEMMKLQNAENNSPMSPVSLQPIYSNSIPIATTNALYTQQQLQQQQQMKQTDDITIKTYAIVTYKMVIHLLLIYAVLGVTYLLFFEQTMNDKCGCSKSATTLNLNNANTTSPTFAPSFIPTADPTHAPTQSPTAIPSEIPSLAPTLNPSFAPSNMPSSVILNVSSNPSNSPSLHPTPSPSINPSLHPSIHPTSIPSQSPSFDPSKAPSSVPTDTPSRSPTAYYEKYNQFVGDLKISAQETSHSQWLLCDGREVDLRTYPLLYDLIGTTFGTPSGQWMFKLPDATNKVMGILSGARNLGDVVGSETITLSQSQIPSHFHYLANNNQCNADQSSSRYLATNCYFGSGLLDEADNKYQLKARSSSSNTPNVFRSSSIGSGSSINIMQPTMYIGNLFIFAA